MGGGKGSTDELKVVRVDDAEIAAPDLDPRDLLADQSGMQDLIELTKTFWCESLA